ncbi:sodium:calcium antiporter [Steroidobacter sp. S1-65]|uniref:Sodium:calcium antiporter n=1 Tax=Steroidobacter gossypii TaxID=2805490 RepID=A0ABS1WY71_9GAMM|nr:sodium:calcium antiporter [Steroidobacter gossypii]MBM0105924.1 sodium:calcium antiporter [Steroidobacter gossypii]
MSFEDLPVWGNAAIFAAAAVVVWFAGVRLARCADEISERTGWGREFLGILLLGGVTSLPELAVGTTATLRGVPALSVSDVLGSAAVNLVILSVADAVSGRRALTSVQGSPGLMLQGVLGVLLMSIATLPTIAGDRLWLGAGISSWLMVAVYLASIRLIARTNAPRAWQATSTEKRGAESKGRYAQISTRKLVMITVVAGGLILGAGYLLARTGESLAAQTGLGTSFFGAVLLAFATSLPEWSTVLAAMRMRRYEMAIADIFGTNLFNVTIIAIVDFMHPGGPVLLETGAFAAFGAFLAAALTILFIVGMLERRDRTVLRMGWDSFAVLLGYIGGLVVLRGLS